MGVAAQASIAIGSVLVLLGLMAVVRAQARSFGLSAEVQRKLVHIGTGLYALALPWLFADPWPVYMLIGLTLVVMGVLRLPRFAKGGIGETLHGVERQSYGDILLALAVGVVFLLSEGQAILYVLPIATLTLADAAAALTGSRYGRQFFAVEDGQKSVEGSVAFFMITLILSMICLLLLSEVSRTNVILLSVVVAAFGTLVEADSWRGFDNFFLPTGLMVFLATHLDSPPMDLLILIILFLLSIWAFLWVGKRVGLTAHAARVYVIAVFLLLSVTQLQNAVLPMLVFAAHAWSRRTNPCDAQYPELDIVAALALISFAWLTVGIVADLNALAFYGLNAMGISLALITLALVTVQVQLRLLIISAFALALITLYFWLMGHNSSKMAWMDGIAILAISTAALTTILPVIRPRLFASARALNVALVSSALPMVAYLWLLGRHKGWI